MQAVELKSSWNYTELPEGMYSACVLPTGPGNWVFTAYPNRGDHCIERICGDRQQLQNEIERWIAGEHNIAGWYSAAY